jgi:uncharacterized protein YyaL (SSP411 family)
LKTNVTAAPPRANRLAREKSPYLLQHAHNPVDWYPWGAEAFEKARRENKPIFLSIGYSTCHWCHVMERESFENEAIARLLNTHFVSIKVDREERPDVDKIYMTFVQATTGSGGWPLNVFLTPDLKPFYGGTYFPPDNRYGRPSFPQVLEQIARLWNERRDHILASADDLRERLQAVLQGPTPSPLVLTADVLRQAGRLFKAAYDPHHGGFGGAPKFPQPALPSFLLRYARRFRDAEAAHMVLHTCERMAAGGIHDQLGGGFARYAVDAQWLVPHFEKMLYDNAQLAQLYLDAFLVCGDPRFAGARQETSQPRAASSPTAAPRFQPAPSFNAAQFADVARDILDYVLRDMTHPDGGFYSAEDADSEGYEGKFYCWTRAELQALLSPEEFTVAARYFGITEQGNFLDHSHPNPLPGQNVLSVADPRLTERERALLASAKAKMFAARSRRVRPQRDDKILASWNGLMLGAFARAAAVLDEDRYRRAAERNLAFLRAHLWDAATRTLHHRWREGECDTAQLLEDYACVLDGTLHLYETTLDPAHLEFAVALADAILERFYDRDYGGFWQSAPDAADLILRVKDDYDGAEPSGNSVATLALLRLASITGRKDTRAAAEATLRLYAQRLQERPEAMPWMLCALDFWLDEPARVVVAGDPDSPRARALIRAAHSVYQPNKVVLGNAGPVEEFSRSLPAKDGPVVYLCTGNTCQPPTNDPARVAELVRGDAPAATRSGP